MIRTLKYFLIFTLLGLAPLAFTATGMSAPPVSVPTVLFVAKTANEIVNNSSALQIDDHLEVTMSADTLYLFELLLEYNPMSGVPGIKVLLVASQTPQQEAWWLHYPDDLSGSSLLYTHTDFSTGHSSGGMISGSYQILWKGIIKSNATTGGTFQLQWAQRSAWSADSTLYAGSYLMLTEVQGQ